MPSSVKRKKPEVKRFKSKFERRFAEHLAKLRIKAEYEAARFPYTLDCVYNPDWKLAGGVYLETKGNFKASERRKVLAVLKAHPKMDLRMVFQRNNRISKVSKTTYGSWCDKHGIRWSVFPDLPL